MGCNLTENFKYPHFSPTHGFQNEFTPEILSAKQTSVHRARPEPLYTIVIKRAHTKTRDR